MQVHFAWYTATFYSLQETMCKKNLQKNSARERISEVQVDVYKFLLLQRVPRLLLK